MRVVAFNGSPRKEGNTFQALKMVTDELVKEGIDVEIIHVGNQMIKGCLACGACRRNKDEKCVITGDSVNEWIQKMITADGILLGTPVYFSGIAGTMKAFLDRAFYVANTGVLRHKVGASVVAVRRSGGIPTFNQLNNYINYAEMVMPSTNYWNVIHGAMAGEVQNDEEGKQIMRVLGKNMAWLLKCINESQVSIEKPNREDKVYTNFIR